MPGKNVIIIGAGIGGITTAAFLAKEGCKVTVFEKNAFSGGRCSNLTVEGHRFDMGATMLMMPDVYKNTYEILGKDINKELELIRMDPIYQIRFPDDNFLDFTSDLMKMQQQLEKIEKGSYVRFLQYMNESFKSYQLAMKHLVDKNFHSYFDFLTPKNLMVFFKIKALKNHYKHAGIYFKSELLRIAFTFQNIFVGQNPMQASAVFSMLAFMELTDGVWCPKGGMSEIVRNLEKIALENKVQIRFKSSVKEILIRSGKAEGVVLHDDTFVPADIIIANADLPYVYRELLPSDRYSKKLSRLRYTCSTIVFYWGMDKVYPQLEQHTVFVSENYKKNIQAVFEGNTYSKETSFYLLSPAQSDKTAAPEGHDAITVIVPAGRIVDDSKQNWEEIKNLVRKNILDRLSDEGLEDFEDHISFERCYTPQNWESMFNLTYGATFGSLSHNIMQMGYMRPHNRHSRYRNLFFTGGSTHPGNGVPMSLISAKLTTERVKRIL